MRICPKCNQNLELSEFCKDNKRKDKLQLWCKKCNNQNRKFHYHNNPENREAVKKQSKDSQLKNQFGITLQEYEEILEKQNGVCAICGCNNNHKSNPKGDIDRLSVDHNHQTGKVRGLLCSRCNFGIGQFNDDPTLLISAIDYLLGYMSNEEIFGTDEQIRLRKIFKRKKYIRKEKSISHMNKIAGIENDWQTPFNAMMDGIRKGTK